MATAFRAIVMLTVLVGLPSAWVYYGPLPPAAMGVIERTIVTAKQSLGLSGDTAAIRLADSPSKTAPRFDPAVAQATSSLRRITGHATTAPPRPIRRDPKFSLASASIPKAEPSDPMEVDAELAKQLEPHLSLLRAMDAAEYTLENWGGSGKLYRFRCAVALSDNDDHTRQFEAVHADPLRAVHEVVGEVTSWQNARHSTAATRWQ